MTKKTARLSLKSHAIIAGTLAIAVLGVMAFWAPTCQANATPRELTESEKAFANAVMPVKSTLIALEADATVDHSKIHAVKTALHILSTLETAATGQPSAVPLTVHAPKAAGHRDLSPDESAALTTTENALKTFKASTPHEHHGAKHSSHHGGATSGTAAVVPAAPTTH